MGEGWGATSADWRINLSFLTARISKRNVEDECVRLVNCVVTAANEKNRDLLYGTTIERYETLFRSGQQRMIFCSSFFSRNAWLHHGVVQEGPEIPAQKGQIKEMSNIVRGLIEM